MRLNTNICDELEMENRKLNIIIIDRQELVRKHLDSFLHDSGHQTLVHENLADLRQASRHPGPCDVVMIDPGPTQEGAEKAIAEVHAMFPRADILIMDHVILKSHYALTHGVYAYLKKPIRLAELELLLARIAEKRSQSHAS